MIINKKFQGRSFIKNFYYNRINKNIIRKNDGKLLMNKGTSIYMGKGAKILLNGVMQTNSHLIRGSKRDTIIRMDEDSTIEVEKSFFLTYGADMNIFKGGKLKVGSAYINANARIRCTESITMGNGIVISHDVVIMDSDGHTVIGEKEYIKTAPIVIGDNVWIGSGATILKGVTIGNNAIIGAKSVVTKDVPEGCIVVGSPAHVVKKNVTWKN